MQLPTDIALRWMTYDPAQAGELEALLSPEERERVARYTHAGRRQSFTLGRATARTLLAERLRIAPAQVPLRVAEDGGVDVDGAAVTVSIAHSGAHAVAAIAERAVGIDLEGIARRHESLPRFLLHPDEYAAFDALPLDPVRAAILYWTLKEATLKALRTGFRLSPKKLRLEIDLPAQSALVHIVERPPMHLRFEEREAYYLAVAFGE